MLERLGSGLAEGLDPRQLELPVQCHVLVNMRDGPAYIQTDPVDGLGLCGP